MFFIFSFTNQNPSFRVFEVDQDTNLPVQYNQYRLNLSKVNENKTNDTLVWDVAYDILSVLKFPIICFLNIFMKRNTIYLI